MGTEEEPIAYPRDAVERAMKVQEVIVRALAGTLTWPQAADIPGRSPRSIRRVRWRLEHFGYDGLFDRVGRRPRPSGPRSARCKSRSSSFRPKRNRRRRAGALPRQLTTNSSESAYMNAAWSLTIRIQACGML